MTPTTGRDHRMKLAQRASMIVAVIAVAFTVSGCRIHPIDYVTSVPEPAVSHPARYLDPVFGYSVTTGVHYATADDLGGNPVPLALDVYQPNGDTAAARPAMIVVHEGGFATGDKSGALSGYIAQTAAQEGYVAVAINYRLLAPSDCAGTGDTPSCRTAAAAATSDAQAAVRWLRANAATYRIDPTRIAMTGMSAGAIVAIMVGITPDIPDHPTDPLSIALTAGAPLNTSTPDESSAVRAWVSISGGLPPGITSLDGGLGQALVDHFSTLPSPGYEFSGTADTTVPFAWAEATRDQLSGIGRFMVFDALSGAGHIPTQYLNEIQSQTSAFMYYLLDLAHADQ